jgi:hypothetical protein
VKYKNYPIQAMIPGVGGWVIPGAKVLRHASTSMVTYRFSAPNQTLLVDRCARSYEQPPVLSIGKLFGATQLVGEVKLKGAAGVVKTYKDTMNVDGNTREVGVIALDGAPGSKVAFQERYAGPCGKRPASGSCLRTPISSINGVIPDCNGNIDIEFIGENIVGTVGDGIILDSPIGLADVCPQGSLNLVYETSLTCGSDTGTSAVSETPSGSPSDSSASSINQPDPQPDLSIYCENFEDNAHYLTFSPTDGFILDDAAGRTKRIVATTAGKELIAINNGYRYYSNDGYTLSMIVRPYAAMGEGHAIFGYDTNVNFFWLSVLLHHPLYPYGAIALGRRVAATAGTGGSNGIGPVGSGYVFLSVIAMPNYAARLVEDDYQVDITVSETGPLITVNYEVTWGAGSTGPQVFNIPINASIKPGNRDGKIGFGTLLAFAEFDNLAVNCTADPAGPGNDNIAYAYGMVLSTPLTNQHNFYGTKELGEPLLVNGGTASVWFVFQPTGGEVQFRVRVDGGNGFTKAVGLYRYGPSFGTMELLGQQSGVNIDFTSTFVDPAVPSEVFFIQVEGYGQAVGTFDVRVDP